MGWQPAAHGQNAAFKLISSTREFLFSLISSSLALSLLRYLVDVLNETSFLSGEGRLSSSNGLIVSKALLSGTLP